MSNSLRPTAAGWSSSFEKLSSLAGMPCQTMYLTAAQSTLLTRSWGRCDYLDGSRGRIDHWVWRGKIHRRRSAGPKQENNSQRRGERFHRGEPMVRAATRCARTTYIICTRAFIPEERSTVDRTSAKNRKKRFTCVAFRKRFGTMRRGEAKNFADNSIFLPDTGAGVGSATGAGVGSVTGAGEERHVGHRRIHRRRGVSSIAAQSALSSRHPFARLIAHSSLLLIP